MYKIFIIITAIVLIVFVWSCNKKKKYIGGPYYFTGIVHYEIPFKPINEISYDQLNNVSAYNEAYYDKNGHIVDFKKYSNGKIEFEDRYVYDEKGKIKMREMFKSNGEKSVQYFDEKGNIIPDKN